MEQLLNEELSSIIKQGILHYLEDFQKRINGLAVSIPETTFWIRPHEYGNSMGNLIAHLTGNIRFYIGAQLARTDYVRDREHEFSRSRDECRDSVMLDFNDAIDLFKNVLEQQSRDDWGRPYSATGVDDVHDHFGIILRCTMHLHHHIGQMIYIRKAINKEVNL